MYIYNITLMVDFDHADSLLRWLKSDGIALFASEGKYINPRMMQIVDPSNPEGEGFALQFDTDCAVDEIRVWESSALPRLFGGWMPGWQRYMVYFSTIMLPR